MKVERRGPQTLAVEFESEAELRAEERANLAAGGLFLRTPETFAPFAILDLTLRLAGGGEMQTRATVVGAPEAWPCTCRATPVRSSRPWRPRSPRPPRRRRRPPTPPSPDRTSHPPARSGTACAP